MDYVLIRRRDWRDVLVTKAIPDADGNEQVQRLAKLPVAAADENASVGDRWHQLRGRVQSTTLAVLGHARSQHQDWFDDNDTAINSLLPENRLHKAYVDRPTEANNCFLQLTLPRATVAPRDVGHLDAPTGAPNALRRRILQGWADHLKGVLNRPAATAAAAAAAAATTTTTRTPRSVSSSSARKRPDRTRSLLKSTSTMDPNSWII
nr:unnamed protein product [Spirometra erinaceieuropaei]